MAAWMGNGTRRKMRGMRGRSAPRMQGRDERYEYCGCAAHPLCAPCVDSGVATRCRGHAQGVPWTRPDMQHTPERHMESSGVSNGGGKRLNAGKTRKMRVWCALPECAPMVPGILGHVAGHEKTTIRRWTSEDAGMVERMRSTLMDGGRARRRGRRWCCL